MPDDSDPVILTLKIGRNFPCRWTFARASPNSANCNDWFFALQESVFYTHQLEISTSRKNSRSLLHDFLMRKIRVSKNHFIGIKLLHERGKLFFSIDVYSPRIKLASNGSRKHAIRNSGNLFCSKGYNFVSRVITEESIEVMEIPSCRSQNYYFLPLHFPFSCFKI